MRRLANYIILRFFQSSPSHQVIFLFHLAWRSPGNIPFGFELRVFLLLDELPNKANEVRLPEVLVFGRHQLLAPHPFSC